MRSFMSDLQDTSKRVIAQLEKFPALIDQGPAYGVMFHDADARFRFLSSTRRREVFSHLFRS